MHISEGVLSAPMVAATSVAAVGLVAYSLKGIKEEDIPRISLMSAVFFVGSFIHVNVGGSSVHLLLTGIIAIILGRRTPIAISIALLLQALLFQYGGLTTYGANIINMSLTPMIIASLIRPLLGEGSKKDTALGAFAGFSSVVFCLLCVSLMLVESNIRYGFGAFSSVNMLIVGHIPVMLIEAVVTGIAVRMILKVRPEIIKVNQEGNK
jgi:cobalt/nickel transport system permease protein